MARSATLSTILDPEVKRALSSYCKRRGLKLRFVVEQALLEQLEDEIDLEAYSRRKDETRIPLDQILQGRKNGARKRQ